MSKITNTTTFKVAKWFLIGFAFLSMIFTTLTIAGQNNFAQMTLTDDGERIDEYAIDISDVENKKMLKEEIDLLVQKQIVKEKQADIEETEKELNAKKTSLE